MKKYLVTLVTIPEYVELEISAKNWNDAEKKANKILKEKPEFWEMEIDDIAETS